jgi:hypothetical protein
MYVPGVRGQNSIMKHTRELKHFNELKLGRHTPKIQQHHNLNESIILLTIPDTMNCGDNCKTSNYTAASAN